MTPRFRVANSGGISVTDCYSRPDREGEVEGRCILLLRSGLGVSRTQLFISAFRLIGIVVVTLWMSVALAFAQAQVRHIETVSPRIGQQGTTVEMTIQGFSLKNPREVIFYDDGIKAIALEQLPNLPQPIGLAHGGRIEEQIKCRFEIAPDCPPGRHPFRIRTATELTGVGTFHVTPFPVINEDEKQANTNDTLATAMAVAPNVTVCGRLGNSPRDDIDIYKVPAVAGQRLSVEADSERISDVNFRGSEYDVAVRVLDESGRELATNDDNPLHLQDPLVSLKLPKDGFLFVEIRRSVFKAYDTFYCVHIGSYHRPLAVFPPGGPAGKPLMVKLLGDPLGDYDATVTVPKVPGTFDYFGDGPSPLPLRSSPFENVLEDPDANETVVSALPVAINGILEKPGDTDVFRLSVQKGDRYRVRVYSAALGSPLDPEFRIRHVDSRKRTIPVELAASDADLRIDRDTYHYHGGNHPDPSAIWEPKADGDYLLEIQDTVGFGTATGVYRIEIDSPPETIHFRMGEGYGEVMGGIVVPQGGRQTVVIQLREAQGTRYSGPMDLIAEGLPKGVRLVYPPMPGPPFRNMGYQPIWLMQIAADSSAPSSSAIVTLAPKQEKAPFVLKDNRLVVAVTERAPITIDLVPPTIPLVRGGELSIVVKLTRQAGFAGGVDFQAVFPPDGSHGLGLPPKATIPAGETDAVLRISSNSAPGKVPLYVNATTHPDQNRNGNFMGAEVIRVSSEIIWVTVADPFVEMTSVPQSVRRGGRTKFNFAITQKSPFEGKATVRLLGLPKGVKVVEPLPVITKDEKEVVFDIEATDEALLGPVSGLTCELIVTTSGQEVRQRSGNGTLRIDPKL